MTKLTPEELEKALNRPKMPASRLEHIKELTRTRRIGACLNAALRGNNPEKIAHWQKISILFYEVPLKDWEASQNPRVAVNKMGSGCKVIK